MTDTDTNSTQDNIHQHQNAVQSFLESYQLLGQTEQTPKQLARLIAETLGCTHALILKYDSENATLHYNCVFPPHAEDTDPDIYLNMFNADEGSIIYRLNAGEIYSYEQLPDEIRLASLASFIGKDKATLVPLKSANTMVALLAIYNTSNTELTDAQHQMLKQLRPILVSLIDASLSREKLTKRVDDIEREAEIFSRIDEELSDTIELNYVFTMMKDWALRFTNANAAALTLYNSESETLRIMSQYGFKPETLILNEDLPREQGGIMLRVARQGLSEIVPDVTIDSDYFALAEGMLAQMSVPIKREEHVIGILTLLSKRINGFTDEHLEFTKRLANRAGVAVDNARLFTETRRERERLSTILRNIGDNVILVGLDHRIEMINSAAILAFQLAVDEIYIGQHLTDAISHSTLQIAYQDAIETNDPITKELDLPNGRTYFVTIEYHQGIGRIIVMQDITYFKETDRLKTELIATVSHDLKQPLAVMRGYLDLLKMVNNFGEKSTRYIENLNVAFYNMHQLIDDLLDIARIEAGLQIELEEVILADVVQSSVANIVPQADMKDITIALELDTNLPKISGDPKRLEQIFNNLVGNAVKYTSPEGRIRVYSEVRQDVVRIYVKDDGMGIGAEDQAKIFERFYRVRRPETDSIGGTGLGLAIVKSLVEAHEGKIDLKSILGQGSTFRVTFPSLS